MYVSQHPKTHINSGIASGHHPALTHTLVIYNSLMGSGGRLAAGRLLGGGSGIQLDHPQIIARNNRPRRVTAYILDYNVHVIALYIRAGTPWTRARAN